MGGERDSRAREAAEIDAEIARAQPTADLILGLADRADAKKAALAKELAQETTAAVDFARGGELLAAAALFDAIAAKWRSHCFNGEADSYAARANDARAAHRLKQRNAKKGKARR